jgi:hypothetical protein
MGAAKKHPKTIKVNENHPKNQTKIDLTGLE